MSSLTYCPPYDFIRHKMITKSEEQKPEPDWKKKWYDDAEKIRMGTVTVINFHMSKLNCMHCYKIASMALELHGRNELYRYKNEMWKKNREDKGYL